MMKIVTAPQGHLLEWAQSVQRFKGEWPADAQAMAAVDVDATGETTIRAVVVATNWQEGHSCNLHIASDGKRSFVRRDFIAIVFRWLFEMRGLRRINAIIAVDNTRTQILALKLGFRWEGRMAGGMPSGSDAILMGMTAKDCRWISDRE